MGNARSVLVMFVSTLLVVGGLSIPAYAQDSSSAAVDELLRLNPGLEREDLLSSADDYAKQHNLSRDEVLQQALDEARAHQTEAVSDRAASTTLPNSYNKGDIFYTDSSIKTGHVGIYGDTSWIVEAPGLFQKSDWWWAADKTVRVGAVLMSVRTSQEKQDAAANHAYAHYLHRDYNVNFAFNKNESGALNCSQLVWAAYYYGAGIDLDGDGGPGVYPRDIRDSPLTYVNWVCK